MANLLHGARQACHRLGRTPVFALTVVSTIALPIAANTLVYAIVSAVLLRPLPLPQPDELVRIEQFHKTGFSNLTGATFADIRAQSRSFAAIAAFRTSPATLSTGGQALQGTVTSGTADFMRVLGTHPVSGRLPDESDFAGSGAPVAFVSSALWIRLLGGEPSAVGRSILVNAVPRTIAGVLDVPPSAPGAADVWLPYGDAAPMFRNRRAQLYTTIGRLRPGVSASAATAELGSIAERIRATPDAAPDLSLTATPLKQRMVASVRAMLSALWAAVALLLLIAAANVANLLSMEGAGRARELSIRAALGARRSRLIGQLAAETGLLALVGGSAGAALGAFAVDAVKPLLPATLPRAAEIAESHGLLAYGVALSVAVVMTFGIWPAIAASRRDAASVLRTRNGGGSSRLRDVFVAAQVAMTLALLPGAALLGRSFSAAARVHLGFVPGHVVTADVSLPGGRYGTAEAHQQFITSVLERLTTSPYLTHVAVTGALPLTPTAATTMIPQNGRETGGSPDVVTVTPELFTALRIPVVRGRLFTAQDRQGAQPVAIINETAARLLWPPEVDPIGRAMEMREWGPPYTAMVIGIVGDVRQNGPDQPVDAIVYYPFAQFPQTTLTQTIVAASTAPLARAAEEIKRAVAEVDRDQPIARISLMDDRIAAVLAPRLFDFLVLAGFAAGALALAGIGIYGTVAFAMAARTREIGVRVALGAGPRQITSLVLLRGAAPVIAGAFAGAAGSVGVARVLQGLVFGVPSRDPLSLAAAAGLIAICAALAIAPAVRRAVRLDPAAALRTE